jgi:hypothetical protein
MADTTTPAAEAKDDIKSMNLWEKLAAITGEVGIIAKDGKNQQQNYSFIEYAAVAGRLRELYAKYHVDFLPDMGERIERPLSNGKGVNVLIKFRFVFTNADKPDETQEASWEGEASDYGDKVTNKAATAAAKYFQMRKFNISEKGDEDPDSTTPAHAPQIEEPQPKRVTIQDAIARAGADLVRMGFKEKEERKTILLKIAGVEDVKSLTPGHMDRVLEVLGTNSSADIRGYLDVETTEEVVTEQSE